MKAIKQFGGNMNKFKIGDLVVQKEDSYSFLDNGKVYEVSSLCYDGFMFLNGLEDFDIAVWHEDFILVEKPDES